MPMTTKSRTRSHVDPLIARKSTANHVTIILSDADFPRPSAEAAFAASVRRTFRRYRHELFPERYGPQNSPSSPQRSPSRARSLAAFAPRGEGRQSLSQGRGAVDASLPSGLEGSDSHSVSRSSQKRVNGATGAKPSASAGGHQPNATAPRKTQGTRRTQSGQSPAPSLDQIASQSCVAVVTPAQAMALWTERLEQPQTRRYRVIDPRSGVFEPVPRHGSARKGTRTDAPTESSKTTGAAVPAGHVTPLRKVAKVGAGSSTNAGTTDQGKRGRL